MKHARSTSSTLWVIPQGALQAFRATLRTLWSDTAKGVDGKVGTTLAYWIRANGSIADPVWFDPETARYATSDMVDNLVAKGHIRVDGDVCSAARLTSQTHAWKTFMTLDEALGHKYLGKTAPAKEVIVLSYALLAARHADDEV